MAMKLVKKTAEYSIYQRGDERYAVKGADKQPINGDEKVRILVAEDLVKVSMPAEPQPEEAEAEQVEDAVAEEETATEEATEEPAEEAEGSAEEEDK